MDLSSLSSFLSSSKQKVNAAIESNADVHVVLGNESSDLDSVVSSIVTGYFLAHSICKEEKENNKAAQSFVFSVINCNRDDLPLRSESTYFLKDNGINLDHIICRDEIDLTGLHRSGKLKLTLVDHNLLAHGDTHLGPSVHRVIDHHRRERPVDRRDIIEPVGSCTTLVTELVFGHFSGDPVVCRLLYGTIVLDTFNFSAAAQRATPKDVKMAQDLEEALASTSVRPNSSELFKALVAARSDVSQLTPDQVLRKDCKILQEFSISLPAVPMLSQQFLELPNVLDTLKSHLRIHNCTAIVILCVRIGEINGEVKKDIVVFADSLQRAKQICIPLENSELDLHLIRNSVEGQYALFAYQQRNVVLSRKFVLPFLLTHFNTTRSTSQSPFDQDGGNGSEILLFPGNGDAVPASSPTKFVTSPLPSISYTAVQSLGIGDPISLSGSSQNSAYNSCPYTPQNSCAEPVDGYARENYFLPSFNSREMIEKIEMKRGKLRGYERSDDELKPNPSSYPFTPKNSYVESNLESVFEQSHTHFRNLGRDSNQGPPGVLHAIDSDLLLRKLMEKQRQPGTGNISYYSSSNSSKSQSLTKLNVDEYCLGGADGGTSPNPLGSPKTSNTPPVSGAMDIPHPRHI